MAESTSPTPPEVRLRLRIRRGEIVAVGPGKVALLEAIAATGSISAAARQLDMSYRRAWLLLDELNQALREPATTAAQGGEHGGGTCLTRSGRAVVRHYRNAESEALAAATRPVASLLRLLRQG